MYLVQGLHTDSHLRHSEEREVHLQEVQEVQRGGQVAVPLVGTSTEYSESATVTLGKEFQKNLLR